MRRLQAIVADGAVAETVVAVCARAAIGDPARQAAIASAIEATAELRDGNRGMIIVCATPYRVGAEGAFRNEENAVRGIGAKEPC